MTAMRSRFFLLPVRFALLLSFIFFILRSPAQPTHYSFSATAGSVIPTNGSPYTGDGASVGVDAAVYWHQDDDDCYWQRFWRHPFFGIRANYAHLRNPLVGDRFELALLLQGPIVAHLDWTYSVGLSFYTNPYRFSHNTQNSFIGSVTNCLIDLGVVYDIPLDEQHTLFLSAKLLHTSDAYLYKPNHGLNYLQAELGLRWGHRRRVVAMPHADTSFAPYGRPFIMLAPGLVTSRFTPDEEISYFFTYSAQLGYIRHFHPCFAWGATFDASYNFSHQQQTGHPRIPLYPAVSAFADAYWGPWALRFGLAHYIGHFPLNWEQYYERVALYYRFGQNQRQYFGVGMKVHYDHIDFIECTYAIEL